MTYIGEDGKKHRPYMVHRALFGSIERFFGILVEQFAGAFPLWLAPIQARILPISEGQYDAAWAACKELKKLGFRVAVDDRAMSLGGRIKDARNERINYLLVIGEREAADGKIAVRTRREGELGAMTVQQVAEKMQIEVDNKIC